jgi:hypothetical protein
MAIGGSLGSRKVAPNARRPRNRTPLRTKSTVVPPFAPTPDEAIEYQIPDLIGRTIGGNASRYASHFFDKVD